MRLFAAMNGSRNYSFRNISSVVYGLRDIARLLDGLKARAPYFGGEEVSDVTC